MGLCGKAILYHALPGRFRLRHYFACGEDVLGSIERAMLKCQRYKCHRRSFWTLTKEINDFVCQFATSHKDMITLLLGATPPLHGTIHFIGMGDLL
jgi:hypothetical protein